MRIKRRSSDRRFTRKSTPTEGATTSTSGRAVIAHIDEAERFIYARRQRAFEKELNAKTARQYRRANKRVKRAFDVSR